MASTEAHPLFFGFYTPFVAAPTACASGPLLQWRVGVARKTCDDPATLTVTVEAISTNASAVAKVEATY